MEILNKIPLNLDAKEIASKLRMKRAEESDMARTLLEIAQPLITPKAVYKVSYVDEKSEDAVVITGIRLQSRVLRKNLDDVGRVFPYIVTIGDGLEERADAADDFLEKYYLDSIGNIALTKARNHLENHLKTKFALGKMAFMAPGSLEDWPITEQKPLFSILDGVEEAISVRLSEYLLMFPRKSVSGIYFPTETTFYSCQLCPRKRCEGRKARYDEKLFKEYGMMGETSGFQTRL